MHGPLFGEFMGTMVLILLGDGVVANVLLKKSKGRGVRLDRDYHRVGIGSYVRRLHCHRLWQPWSHTSILRLLLPSPC